MDRFAERNALDFLGQSQSEFFFFGGGGGSKILDFFFDFFAVWQFHRF